MKPTSLADLLEPRCEEIIDRWEARARELVFGDETKSSVIRNDIPDLLRGMVEVLRRHDHSQGVAAKTPVEAAEPARVHGRTRYEHGFDLRTVQAEYRVLRDTLFDIVEESGYTPSLGEIRIVGDAINAAIGEAVGEFSDERARQVAEAQKSALERKTEFRVLADSIPQLAWIAEPDGEVSWFNQRWFDYTGTTFDEVKGSAWLKLLHPDYMERVKERRQEHMEAGLPWEHTSPFRSKTGEYRRFLTRALPIRDSEGKILRWFGTNTDIEDQLRAEEELQGFFAIVPDMLCVMDVDGRFLKVNPAFETTLGFSEKELLENPLFDFVHPDDREKTREEKSELFRGVPIRRFENRYRTKSGEYRTLSWAMSPAPDQGRSYAVARDITDEKRAAEFRERFFGIIAHDLKTPLTAIVTGASLLFRFDQMPEGALRVARRIASSADRMRGMISELMDFTRARLGPGVVLQRERANLTDIVKRAVEEVNVIYPTRTIHLEVTRGLYGNFDSDRLVRVVANLVKNALDYSPPTKAIDISLRRHMDIAELRIRNDNLKGPIPKERLPTLFDPFRRAAETEARSREGLGLGLYIAREIVLAHGGSIDIASVPEGTTFTVRVPFGS